MKDLIWQHQRKRIGCLLRENGEPLLMEEADEFKTNKFIIMIIIIIMIWRE